MKTEMTLDNAATRALIALCREALFQGGAPRGVDFPDIERALDVLETADRIILEPLT